jgi:1-acyl-sn-glycerol-3-phosphate acyltransferase
MEKKKISGFWRTLCRWIYRQIGWGYGPLEGVEIPKCVICVAPHTSNWDFIVGKIFYTSIGCNARFLIKKEWFAFPLNLIFGPLGGVPVDRSKAATLTEQMVKEFSARETFQVAITPEGTRKPVKEWKRGFYYIAQAANVPILLIYMDYAKKEMGVCGVFHPTGDVRSDIAAIRTHYRGFGGRHRENFIEL